VFPANKGGARAKRGRPPVRLSPHALLEPVLLELFEASCGQLSLDELLEVDPLPLD
jgi:hypothetical protein